MSSAATSRIEIWAAMSNNRCDAANLALTAQAAGFDGISFGDTQCQNGDAFIGLAVAAGATEHLRLGVGVTNPVTRHPATLAAAVATLQYESGGRMVCGVGRGDSAVTKLGLPAARVNSLEDFLARLQRYLSGERVGSDGPLAQLTWIRELEIPKPPVDVAATGPRVMAVAARTADRVTFNLGANPDRLRRGVDLVRSARRDAGLSVEGISLGAYLTIVPHPEVAVCRRLAKPVTAAYARFSGMTGCPADDLGDADATVIRAVATNYDMSHHARAGASHLVHVSDEFIDRFAVVGSPDQCVERLARLIDVGIERFALVGPTLDGAADEVAESTHLLTRVVLPELRRRYPL